MPHPASTKPHNTQWWHQPFRTFQSNLREIDAGLDVDALLDHIADIGANTWLLNTGGIVSFYPSKLPFQHPSPWLSERASGDLVGDAVEAAHQRGVRVLSRVDFSKLHRDIAEAHPDWCFVSNAGESQIYNGLYSTCPSAPYFQERAFDILGEILGRYPVDGFFFNWFGFSMRDYSGRYYGICQCSHCRRRFREQHGLALPTHEEWHDPAYVRWLDYTRDTLADLAGRVRAFIAERNDHAALILSHNPDIVFYEANNAVDRAQPLWVLGTGEFLREARTATPEKPAWVNSVMFLDIPYRFVADQQGMLGLYLTQTLAHGGNPSAYQVGTPERLSPRAFDVVRDVLRFHRDNERYYDGMRSVARVAVVSSRRSEIQYGGARGEEKVRKERRGIHRALVESHVPFDIVPDTVLPEMAADGRLGGYDVLVLPNVAALADAELAAIDRFVEAGGGLVATYDSAACTADGTARPEVGLRSLGAARITSRREGDGAMRSAYLRVTDPADLPGTTGGDLILLDRAYVYVEPRPDARPSFTLIPPSRFGPPEKCYWDIETGHPGLLWHTYGQGRTAYLPWLAGALYHDLSLPEHRRLLAHAVAKVSRRQPLLVTNAPAQVEVVVSEQPGRTLVHLLNYSGNQGRAFHDPLPIHDLRIGIRDLPPVSVATSRRQDEALDTSTEADVTTVELPRLDLFDLLVLEHGTQ